jgi:serine/threonine protein kinase
MSDLEGVILSDYLLLRRISKGGIADVYHARVQAQEGYEVAVKVYRSAYAQRKSFRQYFITQAERIGHLEHPHILPLLEYGEGENLLYTVAPFVSTGTLEELLNRVGGRFSAMQALPIVEQVCGALQYAHEHDVLHGNLKLANIFVAADGRMLLADFSLMRGYDDSQQSLTRIGWRTAEYTAPEQSLGVLRRSSDIYALGVLLFRILTGSVPFTGKTPIEVLLKHVREPAPSARTLVASISDAVDSVLQKAMRKRVDERFASVEEMGRTFQAAVVLAPIASPVAKVVPPMTAQPAMLPEFSWQPPVTPLPLEEQISPQTPLPASMALLSSTPENKEQLEWGDDASMVPNYASLSFQESLAVPLKETEEVTPMGTRKRNFLQEPDERDASLFWSANPAEWSPIARPSSPDSPQILPLTAREYLHNEQKLEAPPEKETVIPEFEVMEPERETEPASDEGNPGEQFRKILPYLVVVLLLIGLAGAVLSAFLYQ